MGSSQAKNDVNENINVVANSSGSANQINKRNLI
jgi:hypothetical protein